MAKQLKVKKLMTRTVRTVSTNDLMTKVRKIFEKNTFHHLPVIDENGKIKGIISRLDYNKMLTSMSIFNTAASVEENDAWAAKLTTEDVMTEDVITLREDDDIIKAIVLLHKNKYHAFPVVNDQQKVIGMLTTYDLINYAFRDYGVHQKVNTI